MTSDNTKDTRNVIYEVLGLGKMKMERRRGRKLSERIKLNEEKKKKKQTTVRENA